MAAKNSQYLLITDKRTLPFNETASGAIQTQGEVVIGVDTLFLSEMPAGSWLVDLTQDEVRYVQRVDSNTRAYLNQAFTANVYPVSLTYNNLVGTFTVGETVTGTTSLDTGVVVTDSGTVLVLKNVTGEFTGETDITGNTSGATADITGIAISNQIISRMDSHAVTISVQIPAGLADGEIDGAVMPAGTSVTFSKDSRDRSGKTDFIDPIIVDATGTQMQVSISR